MAWNELEHRRDQERQTKELVEEARRAKELIAAGDLAGAAEPGAAMITGKRVGQDAMAENVMGASP